MGLHYAEDTENKIPENKLGTLLRLSIAQQSVSIRQLSQLTGISAATISRIITGKQTASVQHLQAFAKHLGLSMKKLLQSVGVTDLEQISGGNNILMEIIQDIVEDLNINLDTVAADIRRELEKLEQYARTKEGKRIIVDTFPSRMDACDGAGAIIDKLNHFYALFCSGEMEEAKKAVIGSALLYFCLTIGVIPDYCFPIGYLDDAMALKMVEKKLLQMNGSF